MSLCRYVGMSAYQCSSTHYSIMHIGRQGTFVPQVFHIRLPRPTISVDTNNHGQIQTLNIQYEYAKKVYGKSLLQDTSM